MKKLLALIGFSLAYLVSFAQELDQGTVKSMVDSGSFVFVARTMVPAGGTSKQLDQRWDVNLTKDSLILYLPYAGRAYTGVAPGESGINFTSTDFSYKSKFKKKKWEVSIKPNDSKVVREMHFTIFENGQATLAVTPVNKQSINYYGYLKKRE